MIGRIADKRGHWIQAIVTSVALHGVAAAAMMDVLPGFPDQPRDRALPEIDILSLPVEQGTPAPVALDPVQQIDTAAAATQVAPQTVTAAPSEDGPSQVVSPVLTPADDMLGATANTSVTTPDDSQIVAPIPQTGQGVAVAGLPPAMMPGGSASAAGGDAPQGSAAQNAAISDLVLRLRAQLDQPCLAALPQTIGGEEVMLTVLGAEDRDIADLFRDMAGSVEVPMTERSILLDARQCPAVDFARSSATYPALPLIVRLEASEVASDDRLVGQIEGAAGLQTALLLIDDNGVVQDLRRFTLQSGDAIRFDVPVYRTGGDRDTSQLLMAIALPERPASISELAGRLASDFFPPLADAAEGEALIGVAPIYVRAAP
ncbi:hypothetical protein [Paracoccus tegillarcae]|nr:hypothetical protein [Paracoccus tegillarcae]